MICRGRRAEPRTIPTVLLYALSTSAKTDAAQFAKELGLAHVEVRDLRAACKALEIAGPAMLVASEAIKHWDRVIVDDHAVRASVPIRWIGPDDWYSAESEVRRWVFETKLRLRIR